MADVNARLINMLQKPSGKVDAVLDTDAYNEVDDQFALAYMLRSAEKLNVKAIYAAPFHNHNSDGPADGMEKSYDEIIKLLDLLNRQDLKPVVFKGSRTYLPDEITFADSPAARDLAERALEYSPQNPLYVVAIGAITNVASAIILCPSIIENIVIVWLGGHSHSWPKTDEFNMKQDVAAARVVFGSTAAVVQLPCMGVVSAFHTSGPELEYRLRGKNPVCDYLVDIVLRDSGPYTENSWSRIIWDVTAVAWLLGEDFTRDIFVPAPLPQYDHRYSFDPTRHLIKYVYHINRDALFNDLFKKLTSGI